MGTDSVESKIAAEASFDAFWQDRFSRPVELAVLPCDRPRPAVPSYLRDDAERVFPSSFSEQLDDLSARLNVPSLAVLIAAIQTVLFRYGGQDSFLLGAVSQTALLSSNLPILPIHASASLAKNTSGRELALEVAECLREVMAHASCSLQELQSRAGVDDAAFGRRLFNVTLCLADAPGTSNTALDWPMGDSEIGGLLAQCDLTVTVTPSVTGMRVLADYDSDLFDKATVERLLGHMGSILEAMVADPSIPVLSLPILTAVERQTLLLDWNSAQDWLPPYATLHEWFEAQVEQAPEAVALTYDGRSISYGELNRRANTIAHALRARGVRPDVVVGLCLDRSPELVMGLLGILKAGGAYLPIDLSYPQERLAFMLEDAQAPIVVTHSNLAKDLPLHHAHLLCVDDVGHSDQFQNSPTTNPPHLTTSESLAYVIYTSGTTGKSKGALVTHRNVARLFTATQPWYGFDADDVWTLFHSTAFDFSVWEMWGALLYGGRLVIVPFGMSRSPQEFYELLANERVTVLNQTPSAFRQLIQAEQAVGQKQLALRYVIFGGEALELQSLKPWFECHGDHTPRLVNMYGITETTVHVTYRPLSNDDVNSGSVIGVPIPDLQVYILDEQKQPVPIGVAGEMYVGGAGLAKGYLRRPELTAERFIPDHLTGRPGGRLYKTGDLARYLPGRDLEYLGRIDHQVKIRGFRIELGEIESVLCQHPAVREAVVVAREDVPGVKTLAAYVVTSSPAPELSSLRDHLKKKLPDYMLPAAFVYLEKLPLTNNGKIDRKALPEPEQQRPELLDRFVAPRTEFEAKLAAILANVLRLDRVGIHDNFFELGGDSILSIQAISSARREGLILSPQHMFSSPTIAELAAVIERGQDAPSVADVAEGDVPLTPIQHWFFEQNLDAAWHYNQAVLLEVTKRLNIEVLRRTLEELTRHHDALRLRYACEGGAWRQFYTSGEDKDSSFKYVDIAGLDESERLQRIETHAQSAQASLNLHHGPIWKVVYFDAGVAQTGRLLIVVHHLAIDGVSWRPLLEDLETAYEQLDAGQVCRLPGKTSSYKAWSQELQAYALTDALDQELSYWNAVSKFRVQAGEVKKAPLATSTLNTEEASATVTVSLTNSETESLLHRVPSVYNSHINDVLLTALARAWQQWTGSSGLYVNLEGHGRERLLRDLDISRTVGWFTSIFPVQLQLPEGEKGWEPGEALKSIKEQLRNIPKRGVGYGLLRFLRNDAGLAATTEASVVFNYFGQFDQVLSGSKLFSFAKESTGRWHGSQQRRRHRLEVNSMVKDGQLTFSWTYCPDLDAEAAINHLASELLIAIRELILHCQLPSAGGRTPSDFPLARLDQRMLDRLPVVWQGIEDLYPLSPIQSLFFSVNPGSTLAEFDQWQCILRGPLNVTAFQRAWHETVHRHSILRSTFCIDGLAEPIQAIHREVQLPWTIVDWRGMPLHEQAERWSSFLAKDREQPLALTEAPVMRFALVRVSEDAWRFLWSVPALLLDGWSWPIVFRDASQLYNAISEDRLVHLEPVRPYRDYVEWIEKQSSEEAQTFWQTNLKGFRKPTTMPSEVPDVYTGGDRYAEHAVPLSVETAEALQSMARRLQLTLSTIIQAGWAIVLSRQSGASDVVFGTAFAGRPVDLRGADAIVGPFVNNLPVRIEISEDESLETFIRSLHRRLLELNPFQYTPLLNIQDSSEIPWQFRPFESLVVVQNYLVDAEARRFGGQIEIEEFRAPIHTNYPVLVLAEPAPALKLTLIYDRQRIAHAAAKRWSQDLAWLSEILPRSLEHPMRALKNQLSLVPVEVVRTRKNFHAVSQNFVPPQNELETAIALVWQKMFGLDHVSVEDNLFDLGGHSLLLVQMHNRLRAVLRHEFPLVMLFMHPTIRSLARYLGQSTEDGHGIAATQTRAQQQKSALTQLRQRWGRRQS